MSTLTDKLKEIGGYLQSTDIGGLMLWAAQHIKEQDKALADARQQIAKLTEKLNQSNSVTT